MGKKSDKYKPTVFDKARDELLSQIRHCGVLQATEEQKDAWFQETMDYMAERYPEASKEQLEKLEEVGRRYCRPVIPHGKGSNAITQPEAS